MPICFIFELYFHALLNFISTAISLLRWISLSYFILDIFTLFTKHFSVIESIHFCIVIYLLWFYFLFQGILFQYILFQRYITTDINWIWYLIDLYLAPINYYYRTIMNKHEIHVYRIFEKIYIYMFLGHRYNRVIGS